MEYKSGGVIKLNNIIHFFIRKHFILLKVKVERKVDQRSRRAKSESGECYTVVDIFLQ